MSTEICILIPDSPDVMRHIGEITHAAILIGSDVRTRRVASEPSRPVGALTGPVPDPRPMFEDNGDDIEAGATMVDPTLTPPGGNRSQRRRN